MAEEYTQDNPYCVQVELTEGCNLRCSFCGLNSIRGKEHNFKFMSADTALQVASGIEEAGWNSRIEFAMHGEPTMNPEMLDIIAVFREALPRAYMLMESNGGGLVGEPVRMIPALFKAGLDCLALDQYEKINLVPKIQERLAEALRVDDLRTVKTTKEGAVNLHFYPSSGPPGNPHQRSTKKRLVFVEPISVATNGTHATLSNHAGCGAPPNEKAQGKRCAKPFREISVRHDGSVAVCCNDWRGLYPIGSVHDLTMEQMWHSKRMQAARRKLYAGQRDFGPCDGCDATSYRSGLLPDPKGKETLEPPTGEDADTILGALADGPLTEPVKRPWER